MAGTGCGLLCPIVAIVVQSHPVRFKDSRIQKFKDSKIQGLASLSSLRSVQEFNSVRGGQEFKDTVGADRSSLLIQITPIPAAV